MKRQGKTQNAIWICCIHLLHARGEYKFTHPIKVKFEFLKVADHVLHITRGK